MKSVLIWQDPVLRMSEVTSILGARLDGVVEVLQKPQFWTEAELDSRLAVCLGGIVHTTSQSVFSCAGLDFFLHEAEAGCL